MVFSSITFLIAFLPLVLLCYYLIPSLKIKNLILLLSSILFYSWGEPVYISLLIISIVINYIAGLCLFDEKKILIFKNRKYILAISITINVLLLFYFKYIGFGSRLINDFLNLLNLANIPIKNWILPIGISFYTFRSISYLIDTYREPALVQRNIIDLGLYVTFFPQLLAGPISRYNYFNAQVTKRTHNVTNFSQGIERFIIGLAKKVLIANVLGEVVDGIYALQFQSVSTYYTWVAALAYALQIYYDFSGYSDMAIGIGKMFGFQTLENFNYPYISKSITEFWKRWHISLSSWFRDYLYIPLGGNRKGERRTIYNIIFVFAVTGLWHGASLNFIFWGLGHGLLIAIEKIFNINKKTEINLLKNILLRIFTMMAVVLLWVPFRVGMIDSIKVILKLFGINYTNVIGKATAIINSPQLLLLVDIRFYIIFFIGIIFVFPWWNKILPLIKQKIPGNIFTTLKYCILISLFFLSFMSIADSSYAPFIYFKF